MVVTPWLRKPALEDFLIDHMSDVCQTCQTFQAAFEILLTYHGSKDLPVFSVQLLICRLKSRPRHDLSVRLNGRTILRLVSDFSTPIHFNILPHPDMWFIPTASTLLSMIFRRHLSHSFPLILPYIKIISHETRWDLQVGHPGNLNVEEPRFSAVRSYSKAGEMNGSMDLECWYHF